MGILGLGVRVVPKKVFRAVYAMNYFMQAGFSMLCPAGLLIFGGWLLVNRAGVGRWALVVSIVLGVLFGFYCMIRFLMTTSVDPVDNNSAKGGTPGGRTHPNDKSAES